MMREGSNNVQPGTPRRQWSQAYTEAGVNTHDRCLGCEHSNNLSVLLVSFYV